ncbi:MAG: MBL fold metallo-hydrolase [Meiothermus sp.]|nr:MBL fold metallo-hydrolase [Meiothermus sp.]
MQIFHLAANAYLLDTPSGPLLVDSGAPWEKGKLQRLLDDAQPVALLLTHHHLDHAGGALMLYERYRLLIYAHRGDLGFLLGKERRPPMPMPLIGDWMANRVDPLPQHVITTVEHGDRVMGWTVVHLPGHTPGQIGIMRDGLLIAADALRVGGKGPELPPDRVNADPEGVRRSVGKISRLEVQDIYVGHGPKTDLEAVRRLAEELGV